ncbi:hypothetical protein ACIQFU_00840 [Streptomyces sp. NPDC093065]|uniref:hypothetical protein n=1 Tax=Streptomyces sp. NPDC093065 TaxID=3366021 RepID=UPI00382F0713
MRVRPSVAKLNNGQREIKAATSVAGKRTVSIPTAIVPDIREHLKQYAEPGADGRVFIGAKGATPRRHHFNQLWRTTCTLADIKRSKGQGARKGHDRLIGAPESAQGQAEE